MRHHAPAIRRQCRQQVEFLGRQAQLLAVAADQMRAHIDDQPALPHDIGRDIPTDARRGAGADWRAAGPATRRCQRVWPKSLAPRSSAMIFSIS